jgi:hypothetical protein
VSQPSVLENLYTEDLYQVPSKVVVVVPKPWSEITEDERMVLSKMLVAVKLSMAHVHIVSRAQFSLEDFNAFPPQKILAFGSAFHASSKLYEHLTVNGTSVILADALGQLDDARKKSLWQALRQMFGI